MRPTQHGREPLRPGAPRQEEDRGAGRPIRGGGEGETGDAPSRTASRTAGARCPSSAEPKIKVLVVDDSAVARLLLCHVIESAPGLQVVGTASDGREAVERVRADPPDVVLMDTNMPGLDGLGATQQIMSETPVPIVVMSAASQASAHASTFQALQAGALAFVPKPRSMASDDFHAQCRHLTDMLRAMAGVKVVTRRRLRRSSSCVLPAPVQSVCSPEVFAIGLSTGGPPILRSMLGILGPDFPLPVLVAQHISPGFEASFAKWLCHDGGLQAVVAAAGMALSPGVCYVAPGGSDMSVTHGGTLCLRTPTDGKGASPSVNTLFASVRRVYCGRAAAALMTGMGEDGAEGLLELRRAGALTFAQDEESCVVYGMPAAAVRLAAATHVLTPAEIARTVAAAVRA